MREFNQLFDFEVADWSKIKYEVRCHWGIHVNCQYPDPVINDYYFEDFQDVKKFVQWYMCENTSPGKKIIFVRETGRRFNIDVVEVAKKIELT